MAHWSGLCVEDIRVIPAPAWYGGFGLINTDWLRYGQDFWVSLGLVKQPIDVQTVVDESLIYDARRQMGFR